MTEHQRWFWRMTGSQRHNYSDATNLYWDKMMATFKREVPVEFAALQFKYAMELLAIEEPVE